MSIESEITRLQSVKSNILHAIADKGVEVPLGSMLADCPDLISAITSGGGGGGGNPYLKNIMPTTGVKVVDENGYIGGDFLGAYYPNVNYYNKEVPCKQKSRNSVFKHCSGRKMVSPPGLEPGIDP